MGMNNSFGSSNNNSMMSDINVTPLVDVMLVLLIIFMVAAPMMTQGIDVELPKVDTEALRTENETTILTVEFDGTLHLDGIEIPNNIGSLDMQVKAVMAKNGTEMVFLKADKNVAYGHVAKIMGNLRKAGIVNIGLVTEMPEGGDLEDTIVPKELYEEQNSRDGIVDKGKIDFNSDTVESSNL